VDISTWFQPQDADGDTDSVSAATDPYDPVRWAGIAAFLAESGTRAGWAETCAAAASAAGSDRTEAPLLGALACSDVPSVTLAQQFAARVLAAQAEVALWIRGARDATPTTVAALQGEIRLVCTTGVIAREGPESPYAEACTLALDSSHLTGDGPATF